MVASEGHRRTVAPPPAATRPTRPPVTSLPLLERVCHETRVSLERRLIFSALKNSEWRVLNERESLVASWRQREYAARVCYDGERCVGDEDALLVGRQQRGVVPFSHFASDSVEREREARAAVQEARVAYS